MLLNQITLELLPPQAVLLTSGVVLTFVTSSERAVNVSSFEGQLPFGTVDVQTSTGPIRIAATHLTSDVTADAPDEDDDAISQLLKASRIIVSNDITDLALTLDTPSRIRLLNFLLGFCRQAFDLGHDQDFARSCRELSKLIFDRLITIYPIASVTTRWSVVPEITMTEDVPCWSISQTRVRRLSVFVPQSNNEIRIIDFVNPGDIVVALGERPASWVVGPVRDGYRDLVQSFPQNDRLRALCLQALVPRCPIVAATIRENAILSPLKPIEQLDLRRPIAGALESALSDGEGKVFLRGWLHDPLNLIASAELSGLAGSNRLELNEFHRFFRPDLETSLATAAYANPGTKLGFMAYVTDPSAGISSQPTLILRLCSGAMLSLRPALQVPTAVESRSAVLTSALPQHVTEIMLETCIAPAAAIFHRRSFFNRGAPEVVQIGEQIAEPRTSVLIPLYRNLSFLRFQAAAFAVDRSLFDAELIYILDSPEQRVETEHMLRGIHLMYDLSVTLVIMPRNLGYAAATNAGASVARGSSLLFLNSDIVPEQPGWLRFLHEALAHPNVGAVGPKLLFDDESLQHAGLFFQRDVDGMWINSHFYKGMPRRWPAADIRREVPGLTGAAILVRSDDFHEVGGISEQYIIGDYEDSDFCLRIRSLGKTTMYVPEAELFHFERRSITLHQGYCGTLACRYNQRLHHRKWTETISKLTGLPPSVNHLVSEPR